MKIEEGTPLEGASENGDTIQVKAEHHQGHTPLDIPQRSKPRFKSDFPAKSPPSDASSPDTDAHEEMVGGEITVKMEPGKALKLARTASQKVVARPPPLFLDLPDATEEAKETFVVLPECTYGNKYLGSTEHALECDCSEEWGKTAKASRQRTRYLPSC